MIKINRAQENLTLFLDEYGFCFGTCFAAWPTVLHCNSIRPPSFEPVTIFRAQNYGEIAFVKATNIRFHTHRIVLKAMALT